MPIWAKSYSLSSGPSPIAAGVYTALAPQYPDLEPYVIHVRHVASLSLCAAIALTVHAESAGPNSRTPTDPKALTAPQGSGSAPVDIPDLLSTVRLGEAAWSPDGKQILYSGNASGRINLWVMNADGTGAHQLLHSDDAQLGAVWSKDGSSVVYQQDRGGDEIYDLYAVAATGGTPQPLTRRSAFPGCPGQGSAIAAQIKQPGRPWICCIPVSQFKPLVD